MSLETVISIGILLVLTYLIWRLNRSQTTPKSKVNSAKKGISRKRTPQPSQYYPEEKKETITEINTETPEFTMPTEFLEFQLLLPEKLNTEQKQIIEEINQEFRKPHPLLIPLIQGGFEPNELFDLIKTDAEMTAKILNAVNSPLFSLRQPITNINHAIIFLGITEVKNIALQRAVEHNLKLTDKTQNEAYKKLWTASYLASAFCLILAQEMKEESPAELSTRCLLSYLGDLAILSYRPSIASFYLDDCSLFERTKMFQTEFGINSAIIGKNLALQWKLPKSIEIGIENSLSSLTNSTVDDGLSTEQLRHILLCYISCRLGDLVAFGGLRDLSNLKALNFEATGEVGFYYTPENLKKTGLDKVNTLITDTNFRKKIKKVIELTY
jgi:hypothetical protein